VLDRVKLLRDNVKKVRPSICSERGRLITESFKETEGYPILIRRAKAFEKILTNMTIFIQDNELIVGNHASKPRAAPIFPEYSVNWIEKELKEFPNRSLDKFLISENMLNELKDVFAYWKGKTHQDRVNSFISLLLDENNVNYNFKCCGIDSVISNITTVLGGSGHIIPAYQRIMVKGIGGILNEAQENAKHLNSTKAQDIEKLIFLKAVIICCNAVKKFIKRFAEEAKNLEKKETNLYRREELKIMNNLLEWISEKSPRNFWEGIQLCWFIHLVIQLESNGHSATLGRMDQYLYPLYQRDIKEGRITEGKALELVECFWIKCYELVKVRSWELTQYKSGYPLFQTISLGGVNSEGRDATNELSYICLKATAEIKLPQPTVVALIHKLTPDRFLMECGKTILQHGGGMPGFFNSEITISSLVKSGVSVENAWNWAVIGCSEIGISGEGNSLLSGDCYINMLKVFELTLNTFFNSQNCFRKNNFTQRFSFDHIKKAYRRQLGYYIKFVPILSNITALVYKELTPTPFLSSLINHRLKMGKDITVGGGPNFNRTLVEGHGLVNTGNSLASIKKLVFDDKTMTLPELKGAIDNNFEGKKGWLLQQRLIKDVPKFGNDDDYVDSIVKELANCFIEEVESYIPANGGKYGVSFQTTTANVPEGGDVGATPDGRKAHEPMSDNISPSPGTDKKGVTAVLKSVAKLDHDLIDQGTILNIKISPFLMEDEKRLLKFINLVRTFFRLGGFQVQFNVISVDTLKNAQRNPDKYTDLMVKVAGYSALFVEINKELQDQIIVRTQNLI